MELHLCRFKLDILLSHLPCRHPKPDIQMQTFLIWDLLIFVVLLFLNEKNEKTCWIYKNNVFANWEKYKVG